MFVQPLTYGCTKKANCSTRATNFSQVLPRHVPGPTVLNFPFGLLTKKPMELHILFSDRRFSATLLWWVMNLTKRYPSPTVYTEFTISVPFALEPSLYLNCRSVLSANCSPQQPQLHWRSTRTSDQQIRNSVLIAFSQPQLRLEPSMRKGFPTPPFLIIYPSHRGQSWYGINKLKASVPTWIGAESSPSREHSTCQVLFTH